MPETNPTRSQEIDVAAADALHDDQFKAFAAADRQVLLLRRNGQYHAFAAHCPHYGAPLEKGRLVGDQLVCPWHHACFRVPGGELCEPPTLDNLPSYPVRVADGRVLVTLPPTAADVPEKPDASPTAETTGAEPLPSSEAETDARTFVIVGAGPAGQMAAQTLRTAGFIGRLVLVGADSEPPYDRTKLSKAYLAGKADDDALPLRTPGFYQRLGIEMLTDARVNGLDTQHQHIRFADDRPPLRYDALLLCPGSVARSLPDKVPGHDARGLFPLRTRADAHRLREAAQKAKNVVVVGGSFIGMEAAASLAGHEGRQVTVVMQEQEPFEKVLGSEIGRMFRQLHEAKGTTFRRGEQVSGIEQDSTGQVTGLKLQSGARLPADVVVLGIGVRPATDFLREALPLEDDGGLKVDKYLQAADHIWAAGDVAHVELHPAGGRTRIEHWRVAQQHGRTAALNMLGQQQAFQKAPFFWTQQFGKSLRYVGHAKQWDDIIVHGDIGQQDFVALYVGQGRIQAAAAMNRDPDMIYIEALLNRNKLPTPDDARQEPDWAKLWQEAQG